MHTPSKTILIFTLLSATNALADKPYEQPICKENTKPKNNITIILKHKSYLLETGDKDCKVNYAYIPINDDSLIILVGPDTDELGINAQNDIYLATSDKSIAKNIGSIPVRADFVGGGTFRDIFQVGGSLFQTTYKIDGRQLTISQPSYELIFSDSQCVYRSRTSNHCTTMIGSYSNPICVWRDNHRQTLARKENCEALQDFLNNPQGETN